MLGNEMFKFPEGVVSRWASYENPDGAKGAGGKERNGRKGAAWFTLNPGEEFVLAHAENTSGVIRRIWITINDQTPETLRGLKLEMFWDGCDKPAVFLLVIFSVLDLEKLQLLRMHYSQIRKDVTLVPIFQCHLRQV